MAQEGAIAPGSIFSFTVSPEQEGNRLDTFIVSHFPYYSRSFFTALIEQKGITVNGKVAFKNGIKLKTEDTVIVTFPGKQETPVFTQKERDALGIEIVAHYDDFLIINKPAGVIVHPPNDKSTEISLADWIQTYFKDEKHEGFSKRPGIVHRLDKDTSGLMIVALTNGAHMAFSQMFKDRTIHKEYLAIVKRHPEKEGSINFPIARHHTQRKKMAHVPSGRPAFTDYKVVEYFDDHSLVQAFPKTGRTHQIRVHFSTIGHSLEGDVLYSTPSKLMKRQALHAHKLSFVYKDKEYSFEKEPPADFQKLVNTLRKNKSF